MDLSGLQNDMHEWRMEQFSETTAEVQLNGTMQELGELLEIETKETFGYPEFAGDNTDAKMKEVGDIVIYLAGYCSLQDMDIEECIKMASEEVLSRDWHEAE